MLSVEDWAEIRRLYRAEGLPIKAVARVLGISKNTVKAALASDGPPKYQRPRRGSIVDEADAGRKRSTGIRDHRLRKGRELHVLAGQLFDLADYPFDRSFRL